MVYLLGPIAVSGQPRFDKLMLIERKRMWELLKRNLGLKRFKKFSDP